MLVAGTFAAEYSRNRIILRLLERAGYDVRVVNLPLWGDARHTLLDQPRWRLGLRIAAVLPRLFASVLFGPRADVVMVLYPGHFDMPVVKLAAAFRQAPVVFDPFILLNETAIEDRGLRQADSLVARALAYADRLACRCADLVLADTPADADHFARVTGVTRDRFRVLWVGAQDDVFGYAPHPTTPSARVFFHGTYIPLHGIDTIVRAAKVLEDDGIEFTLVGEGQERQAIDALVKSLDPTNLELRAGVPLLELPSEIAASTVCLGIFGTTAKSNRVVPNKVFEYLAVGRPVITADTPAIRSALSEQEVQLVPAGNVEALAKAVRSLVSSPDRAAKLATAGHERYQRDYSEEALAVLLSEHLTELFHR